MKQYPLGMGLNKEETGLMKNFSVTPIQVGKNGEIKYDSVIRQNSRKSKTIFSAPEDSRELVLRRVEADKDPLSKPSREEARELTEETRRALEAALEGKIQSNNPRQTVEETTDSAEPTYFRFTAANQTPVHNSGAKTRIVRMQQMPVDPLEPPKFQFRKQPQRAPSPPAPVLRSPPRKLSKEEAAAWKIPPCVSNWKNIKGFTIPLDKRLAADGRGYESFTINSKFSSLSTALYEAENLARENVRLRGEQMKKIAQQKRQQKERELEEKARSAIGVHDRVARDAEQSEFNSAAEMQKDVESVRREIEEYSKVNERARGQTSNQPSMSGRKDEALGRDEPKYQKDTATESRGLREGVDEPRAEKPRSSETKEEAKAWMAREELRRDRMRERRRELRMEERKKKRGYGNREKERDISERIALGQKVGFAGEVMYDSRLFNTESGVDPGLEDDDMYNVYDKPLFNSVSSTIYKPKDFDRDENNEGGERKRQRRDRTKENKPVEFVEEIKPTMANKTKASSSMPEKVSSKDDQTAPAAASSRERELAPSKGKGKDEVRLQPRRAERHEDRKTGEEQREERHHSRHRHSDRRPRHHHRHSRDRDGKHRRRRGGDED